MTWSDSRHRRLALAILYQGRSGPRNLRPVAWHVNGTKISAAVASPLTTGDMAVLLADTRYNTIEWTKIAVTQPFRLFPFRIAGISYGLDPEFHPSQHRNGTASGSSEISETIQIQLADSKLMLDLKHEQPVDCPTLFWHVHGANFAVI